MTRITDMRGQLLVAVQITTCRGGDIIVAAALQPTGSPAAQLDIIDFWAIVTYLLVLRINYNLDTGSWQLALTTLEF